MSGGPVTKGALVELKPLVGAVEPIIALFQFNPETMRHSWTQAQAVTQGSDPLAVRGAPGETFSFSLAMDVTDFVSPGAVPPGATPPGAPNPPAAAAPVNGIYSRLAALEMLMFPVPGASPTAGHSSVPATQVPAVLFVWGQGRIVPVRVTGLTITEKLFDELLNPTHADAQIELRVLTPKELGSIGNPAIKAIANAAYAYSQVKREAGAAAITLTAAGSITLPPTLGL
jgi:hypothetical protein